MNIVCAVKALFCVPNTIRMCQCFYHQSPADVGDCSETSWTASVPFTGRLELSGERTSPMKFDCLAGYESHNAGPVSPPEHSERISLRMLSMKALCLVRYFSTNDLNSGTFLTASRYPLLSIRLKYTNPCLNAASIAMTASSGRFNKE